MTSKHTPGPWRLWRPNPRSTWIEVSSPRWSCFAKTVVRMNGSKKDHETGLANATLIIAAPDILDALRNARAFMASVMEERGDHGVSILIADAERAISKAEGKES